MQVLKSNAVFLDYSLDIYKEFGKSLKDKYENYAFFSKTYRVSDEFLDNFKNYFKSRNIWNEAMYETDKEQIRNYLKANIAYFLFGDYGFYTVLNEIDKQYLEAIKSISQAKSLINLQRN